MAGAAPVVAASGDALGGAVVERAAAQGWRPDGRVASPEEIGGEDTAAGRSRATTEVEERAGEYPSRVSVLFLGFRMHRSLCDHNWPYFSLQTRHEVALRT